MPQGILHMNSHIRPQLPNSASVGNKGEGLNAGFLPLSPTNAHCPITPSSLFNGEMRGSERAKEGGERSVELLNQTRLLSKTGNSTP